MKEIRYKIEKQDDGKTVEQVLRFSKGISLRIFRRLKQQEDGLLLEGVRVRSIDKVHTGDILKIVLRDLPAERATLSVPVEKAYEDEEVVIYNKPPGMPTHRSIFHATDTLENVFAAEYPELLFRSVNRLDRDTSGLCVVAKNPLAASALSQQIDKVYVAVIEGILTEPEGTIDLPIERECPGSLRRKVRDDGKRAITQYKVITATDSHSLLEIVLQTGRTHQIRVHFSHIGHPLAGDEVYGGSTEQIGRQALHCKVVTLVASDGKDITVENDLPQDMVALMEQKRKF